MPVNFISATVNPLGTALFVDLFSIGKTFKPLH